MANLIVGYNPIIIDTAMTDFARTTDSARTHGYEIRKVIWVGPQTATHTFVMTNLAAKVFLAGYVGATSVDMPQETNFTPPYRVKDFKVSTLGSGKVYIYLVE